MVGWATTRFAVPTGAITSFFASTRITPATPIDMLDPKRSSGVAMRKNSLCVTGGK